MSIGFALSLVAERADLGTAHCGFGNPLAVVLGVGNTRGFCDVLALSTLAAGRAGFGVPCATNSVQAGLGVGEHARIFLALGTNEGGLIPEADVQGTREALCTVGSVRDVGALVEAASVQGGIPVANPVVVAVILVGVAADLADALAVGVEGGGPFAGRVGGAVRGVAVLTALVVTALRLCVEDEVVPEVRALDGAGGVDDAVLASVGAVRSVVDDLTAVEVGALTRMAADLDFTVGTEGIAHAGEGGVSEASAGTVFVDVGPCGRSGLVAGDVLLCPGFEIAEEGSDDFRGLDGVDVVDAVRSGLTVLVDQVPVSIGDSVSDTEGSEEDLTTVVDDGSGAGEVGASHVSPVRAGDEDGDALATGSNGREDVEIRAGASESGSDSAGSTSVAAVGLVPLESGDEFSAVTGQASERRDDVGSGGTAELEEVDADTSLVGDVGLRGSGAGEGNLVDPALQQADDTDVRVGEAIDESGHVGRSINEDFNICGGNIGVFPPAALAVLPEAAIVTEAAAGAGFGPARLRDTDTLVVGLVEGELGSVDGGGVPVAGAVDGVAEFLALVVRADGGSALSRRNLEIPAALGIVDARAFGGVATAPVFDADVLVGVGGVAFDRAARVLLADSFESGGFVTTVVQEASVFAALGGTEAGFPDAERRLAVAGELELEVAVLFTAGTAPVGHGIPDAVVFVVDTRPARAAGDTVGVTAVPVGHVCRGHVVCAPLGRASDAFSEIEPRLADETLAETPVLGPLALRVLGARGLSAVACHAVRGPAALGPVLLAETVPRAKTVVVARNFGRVPQAGTSTSSVVVHDVGPRDVIAVAHVANPVVHVAAVGEPSHGPAALVGDDVAERISGRTVVTHTSGDDLDVLVGQDTADLRSEARSVLVVVAGGDEEDDGVTARSDGEGDFSEDTDHGLEGSSDEGKSAAVGGEVVFDPVDGIPDLSVGTGEGVSDGSGNGRLDGTVDGVEGTVTAGTPDAEVDTPTVSPLDDGVLPVVPGERPAVVLTAHGFETRDDDEDFGGRARSLEGSNHIVTHAQGINVGEALADDAVTVSEVRIPEAVPFAPDVPGVAGTRVLVEGAGTRLALRDTADDLPVAAAVPVAFTLVDESVGAELTTADVTDTRIVVPLADVGEPAALIRRSVELAVVELAGVVVDEPAAANFLAAGIDVGVETAAGLGVVETVFVVRRPVTPTTELTPVTIDGSRGDHVHPVGVGLHLEPVATGFLVLRKGPSFGRNDFGVGVFLLPGGVDVGRGDGAGGRLRSGVTRVPAAEGTIQACDLAGSHGSEGSVRAVDGRTVLAEAGSDEGVP